MDSKCHLIFVYNADASLSSLLNEAAHKLFNPASFECSLCELTYSYIRKKREWVKFLGNLPCQHEFHLRNRFLREHPEKTHDDFPCIYNQTTQGKLETLVEADSINSASTLEQLQVILVDAVSQRFGDPYHRC